jgi:hypothetical protein
LNSIAYAGYKTFLIIYICQACLGQRYINSKEGLIKILLCFGLFVLQHPLYSGIAGPLLLYPSPSVENINIMIDVIIQALVCVLLIWFVLSRILKIESVFLKKKAGSSIVITGIFCIFGFLLHKAISINYILDIDMLPFFNPLVPISPYSKYLYTAVFILEYTYFYLLTVLGVSKFGREP